MDASATVVAVAVVVAASVVVVIILLLLLMFLLLLLSEVPPPLMGGGTRASFSLGTEVVERPGGHIIYDGVAAAVYVLFDGIQTNRLCPSAS